MRTSVAPGNSPPFRILCKYQLCLQLGLANPAEIALKTELLDPLIKMDASKVKK
jgi:hypothetical protein